MPPQASRIVRLAEMEPDQEGDLFVLMTGKEELLTRDGKPYFRVSFRDDRREVSFPIWADSPLAADCRQRWTPGVFYKVRAMYRETPYGPQLDIRKIREVTEADAVDGFDPTMCLPQSRFQPEQMFQELSELAGREIPEGALRRVVETILAAQRQKLLRYPAARWHHHAFVGGLLEHTLSVTRTCLCLAEKYAQKYPDLRPPLNKPLVVAGAILHDIGKLLELEPHPTETVYTPEGALVGHLLLGRDMLRQAAAGSGLEADLLLRLEHIILAHQRLPEWGSPKPPMTPEALIIHYADDLDAKYDMMYSVLRDDKTPGPLTSTKNPLGYRVYRGGR
ncbi:MAG: 3'-5' exoribonuclease YhaM family protein [Thermoguttaceae bacterium]